MRVTKGDSWYHFDYQLTVLIATSCSFKESDFLS